MNLVNKTVIRKEKGVKLKEGDLLDTHSTLNIIINKLYKTIDAKDKIINEQALELADLKIENKKLRKSIYQAIIELDCMKSDAYYEDYDIKDEFYIKLMRALGE